MTIDVLREGLDVREVELDLVHRATGRDARGFVHRGRQLVQLTLATGRSASTTAAFACRSSGRSSGLPSRRSRQSRRSGSPTTSGAARSADSARISARGRRRARSSSSGSRSGRSGGRARRPAPCSSGSPRTLVNQLDTRPGRALKAFAIGSFLLGGRPRRALAVAVLLAPYDHREMTMLGDAGSNAFGAVLGLESVERFTGLRRTIAIGALAAVTAPRRAALTGSLIEATPGLRELDALGRHP